MREANYILKKTSQLSSDFG